MNKINHTFLLFLVIIIEGYIVLSTELLAIRQTIPFVGSGTDTVSIIIASVLMPLAFGYQYGGNFKPHRCFGRHLTVRGKLIRNIVISSLILLPGMSFRFLLVFFAFLNFIGIENRLVQTTCYCVLFLVIPVYLLGQTVPLVTNFFTKEKLSRITGKILFFSTLGSFLGATFSTLILMATIGVHHTVSLNFVLLAILIIMLGKRGTHNRVIALGIVIACVAMIANSNGSMRKMGIINNNQYHTVTAKTLRNGDRILNLNGNYSSMLNDEGKKFKYIEFAEKQTIDPTLSDNKPPRDILVVGAGGFTFGSHDLKNNYIYVDIDSDLKDIAEKHILQAPIAKNKQFIPRDVRAFLRSTDKKFDVIYLDAYLGGTSVPEHLVTQEFFMEVKNKLKDNGIMAANFIASPNFNSVFSRNLDSTLRSVFPNLSRISIYDNYELYSESESLIVNIAYLYKRHHDDDQGTIYTDDKNTVFYDKPKKMSP